MTGEPPVTTSLSAPLVFVVGAQRSGTTYLQNLLGAHPEIVTAQETDFFSRYLASWEAIWHAELQGDSQEWMSRRHKGLSAVLTREDFDALMRDSAERVLAATLSLKPGASVLVDKNPENAQHSTLIHQLFPDARFIHIIRDGRDVVGSHLRAARGWGRSWAADRAEQAARVWRENVNAGRRIEDLTANYMELHYEELVGSFGADLLSATFAFCGVETTSGESSEIHSAFAFAHGGAARSSLVWGGEVRKRLPTAPAEPKGFLGEGGVGAWRNDLAIRDRVAVDDVAGALLCELGYASSSDWIEASPARRQAVRMQDSVRASLLLTRERLALLRKGPVAK